MKKLNSVAVGVAIVVASSVAIVAPAFAETGVGVHAGAQIGIHNGANGGRQFGGMMPGKGSWGEHGTSTPPVFPVLSLIAGNGEPIVGGNITVVSGTTFTITNASNVTYTINASGAKLIKNGTSTAITNLAVGDSVIVQGTVNGNSVTASSVIDQSAKGTNATSTKPQGGIGHKFGFGGIFGALGGFFHHLFGF